MISVLLLIAAIIVFVWAVSLGGIHATAADLTIIGLILFAAAHLPWGDYIGRRD